MSKIKDEENYKPFLEAETLTEVGVDPSTIFNPNPKYVYRWKNKKKMSGSQQGYWKVVDKTHPDFKGMKVTRDDTFDATMFTRGDLILCCTHKETYRGILRRKQNKVKLRAERFDAKTKETLERVSKEGIKAINSALRGIEEETQKDGE